MTTAGEGTTAGPASIFFVVASVFFVVAFAVFVVVVVVFVWSGSVVVQVIVVVVLVVVVVVVEFAPSSGTKGTSGFLSGSMTYVTTRQKEPARRRSLSIFGFEGEVSTILLS